ncbi:hypothetical protein ONZ45_g15276 [Pleurotus djamor]|nr:hypothetical protein ONZ45_g15276 [Pleurotus djamor]
MSVIANSDVSNRSPSPALSYTSSKSSMMDVEDELLAVSPAVHHYCNPMLLIPGGGSVTSLSGPFHVVLMGNIANIVPSDFRDAALQLKQKGAIVDTFFTLEDAKLAYRWICGEMHPCRPHSDNREYHRSLMTYLANDPPSYCSPLPPPRNLLPEEDDDDAISLPPSEISEQSPMPSTPSNSAPSPPASSFPSSNDDISNDEDDSMSNDGTDSVNDNDSIINDSSIQDADDEPNLNEDYIYGDRATNNNMFANNHFSFSLLMAQDSESGYESDSSTMESLVDSLRYPTPDNASDPIPGRGPCQLVRMEDHRSVLFVNQPVALLVFAETYKKIHYGDIVSSHGVVGSIDAVVRNGETRLFYAVRGEFIKRYFSDRYLAQQFFEEEAQNWAFVDMLIFTLVYRRFHLSSLILVRPDDPTRTRDDLDLLHSSPSFSASYPRSCTRPGTPEPGVWYTDTLFPAYWEKFSWKLPLREDPPPNQDDDASTGANDVEKLTPSQKKEKDSVVAKTTQAIKNWFNNNRAKTGIVISEAWIPFLSMLREHCKDPPHRLRDFQYYMRHPTYKPVVNAAFDEQWPAANRDKAQSLAFRCEIAAKLLSGEPEEVRKRLKEEAEQEYQEVLARFEETTPWDDQQDPQLRAEAIGTLSALVQPLLNGIRAMTGLYVQFTAVAPSDKVDSIQCYSIGSGTMPDGRTFSDADKAGFKTFSTLFVHYAMVAAGHLNASVFKQGEGTIPVASTSSPQNVPSSTTLPAVAAPLPPPTIAPPPPAPIVVPPPPPAPVIPPHPTPPAVVPPPAPPLPAPAPPIVAPPPAPIVFPPPPPAVVLPPAPAVVPPPPAPAVVPPPPAAVVLPPQTPEPNDLSPPPPSVEDDAESRSPLRDGSTNRELSTSASTTCLLFTYDEDISRRLHATALAAGITNAEPLIAALNRLPVEERRRAVEGYVSGDLDAIREDNRKAMKLEVLKALDFTVTAGRSINNQRIISPPSSPSSNHDTPLPSPSTFNDYPSPSPSASQDRTPTPSAPSTPTVRRKRANQQTCRPTHVVPDYSTTFKSTAMNRKRVRIVSPTPSDINSQRDHPLTPTDASSTDSQYDQLDSSGVDEPGVVKVPEAGAIKVPEWFQTAFSAFEGQAFGDQWKEALCLWEVHERRTKFKDVPLPKSKRRPPQVADWIKHARFHNNYDRDADINNVDMFSTQWWAWWQDLNPKWHQWKGGRPVRSNNNGEWDRALGSTGKNGLLSIFTALLWWRRTASSPSWDEAIADVAYVLQEAFNDLDVEEPPRKRSRRD